MKYFVIANFGNESIALIQWLYQNKIQEITILSVDTGWTGQEWVDRVKEVETWLTKQGIDHVRLIAKPTMTNCVEDRKSFPSKKFHWCAGFLKGLTYEAYLDNIDPFCESTIVLAKRKASSRTNAILQSHDTSEHFNDRSIWYPLLNVSTLKRDELIKEAGFDILPYTSKECLPCIHSKSADFALLKEDDIKRVGALEQSLGQTMFEQSIESKCHDACKEKKYVYAKLEDYDMGCGSVYGCGE